jgi:hypothetical protein
MSKGAEGHEVTYSRQQCRKPTRGEWNLRKYRRNSAERLAPVAMMTDEKNAELKPTNGRIGQ